MKFKRNKLYLYFIITLFSFVCIGECVNAAEYKNYFGITMTNKQYNNLINLGFSENEIYYMNEETYEQNKDIESELVVKSNKYYKTIYTNLNGDAYSTEITKNEYDNESLMNTRGYVNTEYKNMVSTMSKSTNSFRYKVSLNWNSMPSTRSYDVIGVGFNGNIKISGLVNFSYTYSNANGEYTTSTLNYGKKSTSTGGSATYKLPTNIRSLNAVLYYDVVKNTTNTITKLEMCGDYSHATSNVTNSIANNHLIEIDGINLGNSSISYYDAIPCAESEWNGTW